MPALLRVIALLFTISAFLASAQETSPTFRTGARMVLVPVVVRDREGHTVADLTRDSFQLFDQGKQQQIASFSVERSGPAASSSAAVPSQFIVYFIDDLSLHDIGMLTAIREAALTEAANLKPGDRLAVFSSSCLLAIDFTSDRAKLREVISKLSPAPVRTCRVAPTMPLQISLLDALVKRMTHLPGAKRIVVISAGYPVNRDEQRLREKLIDEAAQAKVTIDALHITDTTAGGSSPTSGTGRSGFGQAPRPASVPQVVQVNSENLNIVADGTGGTVVESGNKPEEGLRALSTPDCIYLLGFVPAEKADGGYHKLKVALKDSRKLNVRARAGYNATEDAGSAPLPPPAAAPPAEAPEKSVTESEVAPAPAKAPAAAVPERTASSGQVSFRAGANLVQVSVVVRDKKGNPVGGLHKGDFELTDRGQKQEIASFSEEKLERPATIAKTSAQPLANEPAQSTPPANANAIPDRFTAYIFDDVHMRRGDLMQLREAVWRNLQETASPTERIAIFTTSRRVFTDFTADLDKLHTALYKISSTYVYRVPACPKPPAPCYDVSFYLGYQADRGNTLALQTAGAIAGTPLPGLNSTGLRQPAQVTGNAGMYAESMATHAVSMGEQETSLTLDALRDVARRMMALAGRRTIILLSQGVFVPNEQAAEMERTLDWAQRAGVVVNTLNSTGLLTGMEEATASEDDTVEPNGQTTSFTEAARNAEMESLLYIADATGGTAVVNSNDYLGGIRRIASPPEFRYILGFNPHDLAADGKYHALSIKLTNPAGKGYTVQARKGYYAPKQGEGLPEAAAKEIENAVFSRDDLRDLPVEMRADVKKSEGNGGELTVSTDIDLKLLHYRKAEGRNCQELTAVAAIFDGDGNFIAGKQQTLTLKLRDETMEGLAQKPPETLQSSFTLSPGNYVVRLVVRSEDAVMTEVSSQVEVR